MGMDHDLVAKSIMTQGNGKLYPPKNNFLSANPEKFQPLIINPRKVDTEYDDKDIFLDGQATSSMEKIKLLGVQKDNLNFNSHISQLCTKASQKVGVLVPLRNLTPCYAKLSLILPI